MALDPAVAVVRRAVRGSLAEAGGIPEVDRDPDRAIRPVLVACSGGADSLALLAAAVASLRRGSVPVVGVTVDHGLQDGSDEHAAAVVAQMAELGADETARIRVTVDPGPAGPEAGARQARYAALARMADHFGADRVLLGHTLDDQAETVLLGLTRGSGGRSVQGMRRRFALEGAGAAGPWFLRPLLEVTRAQTEAACRAEGIRWWSDPHNSDPRFTRSRVRHAVMPILERELGPGVAQALARTAASVREDVAALDDLAERSLGECRRDGAVDVVALSGLAPALATRVLRSCALEAGAIAAELTREHILALAGLARIDHGGRQIQLPGHLTAYVDRGLLRFRPTEVR